MSETWQLFEHLKNKRIIQNQLKQCSTSSCVFFIWLYIFVHCNYKVDFLGLVDVVCPLTPSGADENDV